MYLSIDDDFMILIEGCLNIILLRLETLAICLGKLYDKVKKNLAKNKPI